MSTRTGWIAMPGDETQTWGYIRPRKAAEVELDESTLWIGPGMVSQMEEFTVERAIAAGGRKAVAGTKGADIGMQVSGCRIEVRKGGRSSTRAAARQKLEIGEERRVDSIITILETEEGKEVRLESDVVFLGTDEAKAHECEPAITYGNDAIEANELADRIMDATFAVNGDWDAPQGEEQHEQEVSSAWAMANEVLEGQDAGLRARIAQEAANHVAIWMPGTTGAEIRIEPGTRTVHVELVRARGETGGHKYTTSAP